MSLLQIDLVLFRLLVDATYRKLKVEERECAGFLVIFFSLLLLLISLHSVTLFPQSYPQFRSFCCWSRDFDTVFQVMVVQIHGGSNSSSIGGAFNYGFLKHECCYEVPGVCHSRCVPGVCYLGN